MLLSKFVDDWLSLVFANANDGLLNSIKKPSDDIQLRDSDSLSSKARAFKMK